MRPARNPPLAAGFLFFHSSLSNCSYAPCTVKRILLYISDLDPMQPDIDPPAPSYFTHVSITTPVVSALKNIIILIQVHLGLLELPRITNGFLNHFRIQEAKRPLRTVTGLRSETVTNL
jgi:hypothetical protein